MGGRSASNPTVKVVFASPDSSALSDASVSSASVSAASASAVPSAAGAAVVSAASFPPQPARAAIIRTAVITARFFFMINILLYVDLLCFLYCAIMVAY